MFSEGYVGVSVKGAHVRFREHRSATKNGSTLPVHNFMRKYGETIVVTTVVNAPIEYCYEVEQKLRPNPNIGYNVSAGGESTNLGSRRTEECKAKMSADRIGKKPTSEASENVRKANKAKVFNHTDEAKVKISEAVKARGGFSKNARDAATAVNKLKEPWDNPFADKSVWLEACRIYKELQDNPDQTPWFLSKTVGIAHSKLNVIHKKIKAGWNPSLDTEWLIFSSKLSPDTSGDKSLKTGISPNTN